MRVGLNAFASDPISVVLFREIPGLEPVKEALRRAVQRSHVAHAQLFDGKAGGGALALALAFATYINCEEPSPEDACGRCASCVKMSRLVHPDLHLVFPVASSKKNASNTSEGFLPLWREFVGKHPYVTLPAWLDFIKAENKQGNISVEEARGILRKLSLKSFEGEYKIMLVWKPELMSIAAANALLKILEEPPAKTLFLLVTDQPDRLLTTILSRTQRISVPAFADADLAAYLRQHHALDESRAKQLAYLCDGDLAKARQLAEEVATDDRHVWFADWMRTCYKWDLLALVKLADTFDGYSKEAQKEVLDYGLRLFRDMMIWKEGAGLLLRIPDEEVDFLKNFSGVVPDTALEKIVGELNEAYHHVERNVRAKFVFLDISMRISQLFERKRKA